jgi:hypothetical protein
MWSSNRGSAVGRPWCIDAIAAPALTARPSAADIATMAASSPPTPNSPSRDGLVALAIAAIVAATVVIGVLAPGKALHKAAPAEAVRPDGDPGCSEWSDGCRVCKRVEDGPICSTPGIACTPGLQECLHRTTGP